MGLAWSLITAGNTLTAQQPALCPAPQRSARSPADPGPSFHLPASPTQVRAWHRLVKVCPLLNQEEPDSEPQGGGRLRLGPLPNRTRPLQAAPLLRALPGSRPPPAQPHPSRCLGPTRPPRSFFCPTVRSGLRPHCLLTWALWSLTGLAPGRRPYPVFRSHSATHSSRRSHSIPSRDRPVAWPPRHFSPA